MTTLLAKRAGTEVPMATDDSHYDQMANDPTMRQFPQGSTYSSSMIGQMTPAPVAQQPLLTGAGDNAGQNAEILVAHDKDSSDWINKRWRPAMGWTYMAVCIFDFMIFPVMFTIVQFWETQAANDAFRQWQPLTLQGAGLFHMAMGAVLGIAAYGRTKEKIAEKS